jgi:hypothetical protein
MFQKYFISTGDRIKGISFDTSTTNAVINAFGVVYFINRKNIAMALLCMLVMLLVTSNFVNILLTGILLCLFIFKSDRMQKSLIVLCSMLLVVFMAKISPQNDNYAIEIIKKVFHVKKEIKSAPVADIKAEPDSILTPEERREKMARLYIDSVNTVLLKQSIETEHISYDSAFKKMFIRNAKPFIPEPSIHSLSYQRKKDTSDGQRRLIRFISNAPDYKIRDSWQPYSGKMVSLFQLVDFFKQYPARTILGNGMARFSSKLAFRATALGIGGEFPQKFAWFSTDFSKNHLWGYLYFFSKDIPLHSVINTPNSVYNQLAGEYGLAGLVSLVIGYLAFFARRTKLSSYSMALLALMCGLFFIDYWFEQLSALVIFELFMLLEIKENNLSTTNKQVLCSR